MVIHSGYLCHFSNYKRGRAQPVSFLVLHYVGATGGAQANAKYFHNTANARSSAHYFVGHASEDAEVWRSVPEGDTAWHCGRTDGLYKHQDCMNANSIGIEMCCKLGAKGWYIEEETLAAAAELCKKLMVSYNIPIENVVRHFDVTGKLCPWPLVDESAWANFKERLEDKEVTQQEFNEMLMTQQTINREKPVSDWAKQAWQKATAAGVFDGSAPQNAITREQVALVLDRLGLLGK